MRWLTEFCSYLLIKDHESLVPLTVLEPQPSQQDHPFRKFPIGDPQRLIRKDGSITCRRGDLCIGDIVAPWGRITRIEHDAKSDRYCIIADPSGLNYCQPTPAPWFDGFTADTTYYITPVKE